METTEKERLILVIDDKPDHLQVINQVLAESKIPCHVVSISNPSHAIDFLHHRGDYRQASRPDLILLDAHLADGDSQTVLSEVKSDVSLRRIPTIILSPTADQHSVVNSYQLQCNSYVIKPQDIISLTGVMRVIESFWLNIVTLPLE